MTPRFGIDTSIFVRVLTGDPADGFTRCVRALTKLIEDDEAEILVSNQVIGEAYMVLQHHYGIPKGEARAALDTALRSGLVSPLNGAEVFAALASQGGCGLIDRLIADDYCRRDLETLTLDSRMARLAHARKLRESADVHVRSHDRQIDQDIMRQDVGLTPSLTAGHSVSPGTWRDPLDSRPGRRLRAPS